MTCSRAGLQTVPSDHYAFRPDVPPLSGGLTRWSIRSADRYCPWSEAIDEPERRARLRSLRGIVRLSTGRRGDALADQLRQAEREPAALEPALTELDALAALDRRSVLASFSALHRPHQGAP